MLMAKVQARLSGRPGPMPPAQLFRLSLFITIGQHTMAAVGSAAADQDQLPIGRVLGSMSWDWECT